MKFLVFTLSLLAATFAYPDVSELSGGYNYNRPSGHNHGSANQPSGSYLPSGSHSHISQPSANYIPASGSNTFGQTTSPGGSYIPPSGSNNFGQVSQPSGSYLPGGGSGEYNPNAIQDQKHVYFYAAPDDEEKQTIRIQVAPSSMKNTKIIFIKAPTAGGIVPEVIAPPSSAEDKTLVYVLVKKQGQAGAVTIPSSVGVKQAKPEVYFIKYKNPSDAEKAVSESLAGHPAGSSLPDLKDEQAFVRTFKDSAPNGHGGHGLGSNNLDNGYGSGGLGTNGYGSGGGLGTNGYGSGGLGSTGLGTSSLGTSYGPPGGSGPY